jgi:hypothetical protein
MLETANRSFQSFRTSSGMVNLQDSFLSKSSLIARHFSGLRTSGQESDLCGSSMLAGKPVQRAIPPLLCELLSDRGDAPADNGRVARRFICNRCYSLSHWPVTGRKS